MKTRYAILLIMFSWISPMSHAGGFMAISAGQTDVSSFDSASSYSLAAGYSITDYLATEIAYVDLLDTKNNTKPAASFAVDGINLSVILSADIGQKFGVFGKVGAFFWDARLDDPSLIARQKDDGTDMSIGFGFDYNITDKVEINLVLQKFKLDDDAENVSLGILFRL